MATTTRRPATEEDLLAQPADGYKRELVDGEIRLSPGGARHSRVSLRIAARLDASVSGRAYAFDSSMGFRLPGGNVRSPDASVVLADRLPGGPSSDDFASVAPDLAVEVVSPGDRRRHVLDKVGEYLDSGVRLVWVIDPRQSRATVFRSLTQAREIGPDDYLDGADVLPGFRCRLGDLFD